MAKKREKMKDKDLISTGKEYIQTDCECNLEFRVKHESVLIGFGLCHEQ